MDFEYSVVVFRDGNNLGTAVMEGDSPIPMSIHSYNNIHDFVLQTAAYVTNSSLNDMTDNLPSAQYQLKNADQYGKDLSESLGEPLTIKEMDFVKSYMPSSR